MVARLAYNIVGRREDIEDVVQETFLEVYKSIGSFQGESKFSTWLYRVAVNVALQHLRRSLKEPEAKRFPDDCPNIADDTPSSSPEESALVAEKRHLLTNALERIPPKKRIVFILHEICGIEASEIAKILRIPTLTVRTRLFYARRAIYQLLVGNPAFADIVGSGGRMRR